MKSKTKNLIIVAIIIAILVITIITLSLTSFKQEKTIKIGVIDAYSGDGAVYGEWVRKNTELAAEDINNRGGLQGRQVELIFEDHKASPQEAVNAYQKLRFQNVNIITCGWSSPTLAIVPLANKDKVILMTHSATSPLYSTKDDYTFRTAINANQFAKEEAEFIYNNLNKKKVAVIYINNDFGLGMKNVFIENFKILGGEILIENHFDQGTKDFRSNILKIQSANPDTVFLVGHMTENGLLVKQMNELDFNTIIVSDIYSIEGEEFLKQAGPASEGIIYVAPAYEKDQNLEYYNKYLERYGEEPNYYAQAYDGLLLIEQASKNCPNLNTDCLKDELFKIKDFPGASGILTFDEYGDVEKPVTFKTIKNREFIPYEK